MIRTQIHSMFCPVRRATSVLLLLSLLTISAARASGWGDAPAELTISEYLDIQYKLSPMARPESNALNSYSLVSFYPSSSPQDALVVVIQTWHDEHIGPQDLRREIRNVGEALSGNFNAMARLPLISKRWPMENPKANFVVRHVRYSDLRETIAVTVNGETVFDSDSISKARANVMARGAVWGW